MKRQLAIFLVVFFMIFALGLVYGSRVVADLTVFYPTSIDKSGIKIVLSSADTSALSSTSQPKYHLVAEDTQRVVARRLDQLNLKGHYSVGVHDDQIEVTLPDNENAPYIINIITRVGAVEFIDGGTKSPPIGQRVRTGLYATSTKEDVYHTLFVGKEITSIIPPDENSGEIFYQVSLQPSAAKRLVHFFNFERNAYICLAIDKQVVNCSTMYHWSGNTLDILPSISDGSGFSLVDLGVFLVSGPLPMSLEVVTN